MRPLLPLLTLASVPMLSGHALVAQESVAPFHAPLVVLPVDSAPFQRLLDYDGDGDLDAVGTRIRTDGREYEVQVWRNDQGAMSSVFTRRTTTNVPAQFNNTRPENMRIAGGDWNADGLQDFLVGGGSTVELHLSAPGPAFWPQAFSTRSGSSVNVEDVALTDIDGDGRDDVVFTETVAGLNPRLAVHYSAGGSTETLLPPSLGNRIDLLQADGDPQAELAVKTGSVYRVFDLQQGQLVALATLTTSIAPVSTAPWLWMSGDLDGDGDDDVVVFQPSIANNLDPLYQVFRRGGTSWSAEPVAVGGPAEYLADIDGDGDLDGVCCGGGGGGPTPTYRSLAFPSTFELAINEGGGSFRRAHAFPGAGSRSLAGAADMDGDGDIDLVAGRCLFYGRGPWERHPMPPTGVRSQVSRRYLLADGDRDGDPDLMHSMYGGARNRGDGSFEQVRLPGLTPPAGRTFAGGFSVDVDGDGANDHVLPMYVQSPRSFDVMVLIRNNGGGTYSYAGPIAAPGLRIGTGFTADHFASADADGDGDIDLIANDNPNQGRYGSQVFWQQAGSFVAGPAFPGERIEAARDFDGDGNPDLLTNRSGNLGIRLGLGSPTTSFGQAVLLGPVIPFQPRALTVADLDDDGRLDIVAPANPNPILLLNRTGGPGTVSFVPSALSGIEISNDWPSIEAADFDGNGLCDLAFSPVKDEPNVGLVLMRQGMSGSVPTLADYRAVRMVLPDGFAADADGDGDLDLLGPNVAYSVQHHGPRAGYRVQVGEGVPGEGNAVPVLGAAGPFRAGGTERVLLRGLPGPTLGLLGLAADGARIANFPLPGHTFLLDPASTLALPFFVPASSGGIAASSAAQTIPLPSSLAGLTFHLQAFLLDPAAAHGASCTNGLVEQIGW